MSDNNVDAYTRAQITTILKALLGLYRAINLVERRSSPLPEEHEDFTEDGRRLKDAQESLSDALNAIQELLEIIEKEDKAKNV